ncbi:MAG: hypothetical protein Q4F24_05585 [Eubacteriales bacterium]|nr:hypothetical protein [Eubacteriales bacterium]
MRKKLEMFILDYYNKFHSNSIGYGFSSEQFDNAIRNELVKAKNNLTTLQFFYDFIFQTPDADIRFRKKISTSRCRIQPPHPCQFFLLKH